MSPRVRQDVTVQQVGDEVLVLDLKSEQIHQLNPTAAWILSQCNGENSIEYISGEFADYFSVDSDTAVRDVTGTIEKLNQAKVIELD